MSFDNLRFLIPGFRNIDVDEKTLTGTYGDMFVYLFSRGHIVDGVSVDSFIGATSS